jgi:hypothetical protein
MRRESPVETTEETRSYVGGVLEQFLEATNREMTHYGGGAKNQIPTGAGRNSTAEWESPGIASAVAQANVLFLSDWMGAVKDRIETANKRGGHSELLVTLERNFVNPWRERMQDPQPLVIVWDTDMTKADSTAFAERELRQLVERATTWVSRVMAREGDGVKVEDVNTGRVMFVVTDEGENSFDFRVKQLANAQDCWRSRLQSLGMIAAEGRSVAWPSPPVPWLCLPWLC